MTPKQALAFVKTNGVVLESGRGPVPSLAEAIAGKPIRGSWWAHPKGHEIFLCSRAVRESPDVLVCRLVEGKVTYIHRRLWPALVRLAQELTASGKASRGRHPARTLGDEKLAWLDRLNTARLAAIQELHTPSGNHKVTATPFPDWVPEDVLRTAKRLTRDEAARLLSLAPSAKPRARR